MTSGRKNVLVKVKTAIGCGMYIQTVLNNGACIRMIPFAMLANSQFKIFLQVIQILLSKTCIKRGLEQQYIKQLQANLGLPAPRRLVCLPRQLLP